MKTTLQRTAILFILTLACIWCSGCVHRETSDLEPLRLEENQSSDESGHLEDPGTSGSVPVGEESTKPIFVYVCGAVNTPGVYELKAGSRLYEAIACAGGVREDAAEESINQAQTVFDGERLYIPTDEEVRQGLALDMQSGIAGGSLDSQDGAGMTNHLSADGQPGSNAEGKVNINTASQEELKTLNGIGDTRAGSIVAYRESNGLFGSIEDLMQVDGIKQGVYNKLKDDITVN